MYDYLFKYLYKYVNVMYLLQDRMERILQAEKVKLPCNILSPNVHRRPQICDDEFFKLKSY